MVDLSHLMIDEDTPPENDPGFNEGIRAAMTHINSEPGITPPEVATDGRPCAMDVFVGKLFEDCPDDHNRIAAIRDWLEGDWAGAVEYLSEVNRDNLMGKKEGEE